MLEQVQVLIDPGIFFYAFANWELKLSLNVGGGVGKAKNPGVAVKPQPLRAAYPLPYTRDTVVRKMAHKTRSQLRGFVMWNVSKLETWNSRHNTENFPVCCEQGGDKPNPTREVIKDRWLTQVVGRSVLLWNPGTSINHPGICWQRKIPTSTKWGCDQDRHVASRGDGKPSSHQPLCTAHAWLLPHCACLDLGRQRRTVQPQVIFFFI